MGTAERLTLEDIRAAGPLRGRAVAGAIGERGAAALDVLTPGLLDPAIARHCAHGIGVAGLHGAKSAARQVFLEVLAHPINAGVRNEAAYYLPRLTQSGIGKYMAPYATWHHIVDEIVRPDGTYWYLSACHHWNSEGYIEKRGGLRTRVAAPCPLCDAAENPTSDAEPSEWRSQRVPQQDGTTGLYLRGELAWHRTQDDDSFETAAGETALLTRCGWWVPASRVRAGGRGYDQAKLCQNCGLPSDGATTAEPAF